MKPHTPGPWFPALNNLGSPKVIAGNCEVAILSWLGFKMIDWQIGGDKAQSRREEIAANTRLIASAPELLASLKSALKIIEADRSVAERSFLPNASDEELTVLADYQLVIDAARAALAKAEGGA